MFLNSFSFQLPKSSYFLASLCLIPHFNTPQFFSGYLGGVGAAAAAPYFPSQQRKELVQDISFFHPADSTKTAALVDSWPSV